MTAETPNVKTSAVEISPQTNDLVEIEMADETDEVKNETKALIEAIKRRAQSEIQSAGSLSREAYLKAVRQARETVEQNQLIDRERIEKSVQIIQKQAEKSWSVILEEIESLGSRLTEIAKSAWEAITKHRSNDKT